MITEYCGSGTPDRDTARRRRGPIVISTKCDKPFLRADHRDRLASRGRASTPWRRWYHSQIARRRFGQPARRRVAVVARVARRLADLLDHVRGRRHGSGLPMPRSITSSPARRARAFSSFTSRARRAAAGPACRTSIMHGPSEGGEEVERRIGVEGAAHERSALDVAEAERRGRRARARRTRAARRSASPGRCRSVGRRYCPSVTTVDARVAQIARSTRGELVARLAQPEHEARLRERVRRGAPSRARAARASARSARRCALRGTAAARSRGCGCRPRVRRRATRVDAAGVAAEVGGQHLDASHPAPLARSAAIVARELRRALVRQVVAIHADVSTTWRSPSSRAAAATCSRLGGIDRPAEAGGDMTEATRARAHVAEQHERHRAAAEALGAGSDSAPPRTPSAARARRSMRFISNTAGPGRAGLLQCSGRRSAGRVSPAAENRGGPRLYCGIGHGTARIFEWARSRHRPRFADRYEAAARSRRAPHRRAIAARSPGLWARFGSRARSCAAASRAALRYSPSRTRSAMRSSGRRPAWRVPRNSPAPRMRRSASAIAKPSLRLEQRQQPRLAVVVGPRATSSAGARPLAAPDATAQLVELREAEALGVLDHHQGRVRHVDADLDHGRRDQHLRLGPRAKRAIARARSPRVEAPVHEVDAARREAPREPLDSLASRRAGRSSRFLDERVDDVDLLAARQGLVHVAPSTRAALARARRRASRPARGPGGSSSRIEMIEIAEDA